MKVKSLIFISLFTVCWTRSPFPDKTDNNFQNDCLQSHNGYRAIHHSPNLMVNTSYRKDIGKDPINFARFRYCAYKYRKYMYGHISFEFDLVQYAISRCQLISQYEGLSNGHAGLKPGIGENLYWYGNSANVTATASQGVQSWYNEVANYNYDNPGSSTGVTGHFTQLVWKSTTSLGCARCGGKGSQWYETYIVSNYYPQGNIISNDYQYYKTNVLRP